jgi:hypothetical protein
MTRCKFCKHGINAVDGEKPFVICALIPPTPIVVEEKQIWVRPSMMAHAWCGQSKFSIRKFFFRGPRA